MHVTDIQDQEANEEEQQQTSEQVRSLISIFRQQHHAAVIHLNQYLCFSISSNALNVWVVFCFYFGVLIFLPFFLPLFSQLPEGGTVLTNMLESSSEACERSAQSSSLCETTASTSSGQWLGKTFFYPSFYCSSM